MMEIMSICEVPPTVLGCADGDCDGDGISNPSIGGNDCNDADRCVGSLPDCAPLTTSTPLPRVMESSLELSAQEALPATVSKQFAIDSTIMVVVLAVVLVGLLYGGYSNPRS